MSLRNRMGRRSLRALRAVTSREPGPMCRVGRHVRPRILGRSREVGFESVSGGARRPRLYPAQRIGRSGPVRRISSPVAGKVRADPRVLVGQSKQETLSLAAWHPAGVAGRPSANEKIGFVSSGRGSEGVLGRDGSNDAPAASRIR